MVPSAEALALGARASVVNALPMVCLPSTQFLFARLILQPGAREYSVREELPLPSAPPYTAHLANLSFDASDDDVQDFFRDCEVKEVRLVRDKMDDKPKGFGYVTFGSLEGLKTALSLSNGTLAGRAVRVSVAEPRTYLHTLHLVPH